jgi:hypothetical protein
MENQETINKLRRIYKESTNETAKAGAKAKLEKMGVSLTDEKPKGDLSQDAIDKLRRIYRESTNETAKAGAKKKLEDAGVSLSSEEPKKKTEMPKSKAKPKGEPKAKAEPKKPSAETKDPYDCDDLIKQAKERKAKAKANAIKRANAPKKTPATKNKEAVEKTTTRVTKSVESRAKKGEVKVAEIEKLIAEYEEAIKKLKTLLSKVKSGKKFANGGNMGMMDSEHSREYHKIKDHHCGCGDKMAKGGGIYSSDELYIVKVYDSDFNLLDNSRRVFAKNSSKARQEAIDTLEYEMQQKYGTDLIFRVEEAPSMYAKGGGVGGKLEVGVYKVGKPKKIKPNLYEQKIVEIFENGDIATASDYARSLSDFKFGDISLDGKMKKYPMITEAQLEAQYKMAKGGDVGGNYEEFEMVVISKDSNGKSFKDRFLVSARNILEAKKIATKLWEKELYDEGLTIENVEKYAKGGTTESADRKYSALKSGKRTSRKYASVEMRGGGVYHRRNANQYGRVKGGKTYYEYSENRTDKRRYLAKGGNLSSKESLLFFVENEMSSGMIANKCDYSDYKTIDKIKAEMVNILKSDGDRKYSIAETNKLVSKAVKNLGL